MPLEATMMIIDNSEYMRNGDYAPTRLAAQADAVNVIFQTKTDSNPESTIGLMTMAGKGPEVMVTNTKDLGQVLQGLHRASSKIGGAIDIPTAIAVAQLALKHRENKNLRQRIMVFVGSPLEGAAADEAGMVKLAKKLKKNNVAVDLICFGDGIEEVQGEEKGVLKSFMENVNSGDNSHLVSIPAGNALLSDGILSSAVLAADRGAMIPEELREGGDAGGAGSSGGGGGDFEFGVDPSLDPELAMALRLSMQEAQAREAVENAGSSSSAAPPAQSSSGSGAAAAAGAGAAAVTAAATAEEMDPELAKALAMSEGKSDDIEMGDGDEDEDEDAAIARAIEMSMQGQQDEEEDKKTS